MKKKIFSLVLIAVMVLSSFATVFAAADGTITVQNAAKGETYGLVKVFDATISDDGGIAYTGDIPDDLKAYFEKDKVGNIIKKSGVEDTAIKSAVQTWAAKQAPIKTETGKGGPVVFSGLDYGYYAITSTQGGVVSLDSANKEATVYDKNTKTITADKKVEKESYSIGDTVKYTGTFDTTNYMGSDKDAKQVVNYVISDTLPEYLSDVKITSVKIMDGNTQLADLSANFTAFTNKSITIPWATEDAGSDPKTYTSLYKNGAKIVITYTAKLTSVTNINANDTNTISIKPTVWNPETEEEEPWNEEWKDDEVIKTYAAALHKVDEKNDDLAGAQFTIAGLTVQETSAGVYTVVSYNPTSTTASAVMNTDENGMLYIVGLASDAQLTVTEFKAPDGYNKLTDISQKLTPQIMTEEVITSSGTRNYDAKGNLVSAASSTTTAKPVERNLEDLKPAALTVVNNKGTEMPETGGMGTTIIYILGAALVIGAGVVLVSRKKTNDR